MKPLYLTLLISAAGIQAAENMQVQRLSGDAHSLARNARLRFERQAVFQHGLEVIVPELIIGGEWTSTIKLINKGNAMIPPSDVYFIDSAGNPMQATFQTTGGARVTDYGFTFTLGTAAGILETTFYGGKDTQFGHALIDPTACPSSAGCSLYGEVTLRNRNSSRPDFESVFPLEEPNDVQYLLWDHRAGYSTVLYLVSENTTNNVVSLEFRNTDDRLMRTVPITMRGGESQIITLGSIAPETLGTQGTLVIRGRNTAGGYPLIVATALRVNPSNSFTPMRTFVPK